jgi:hypothetical protein
MQLQEKELSTHAAQVGAIALALASLFYFSAVLLKKKAY